MVKLCKNVHKTTIYECSSFKSRHRRRACWLSGRPCRTSLPDIPGSVSLDPGSRQCSPFCHSCPPVTLNKKIWPIIALCWVDFAATVALSLFSDQHHNITNLTHFPPRRPDNIIEVAQSAPLHLKHLPNQKSVKLLKKIQCNLKHDRSTPTMVFTKPMLTFARIRRLDLNVRRVL